MSTTLLVATHGGHVSELFGLKDRISGTTDSSWVTNEHPQTERMLHGESVRFVPFIANRDIGGVLRALPDAVATMRSKRYDRVISTGSAIALAYLPAAALFRIPAHYIESATRVHAPSVTGRILSRVPGVRTWWQHSDAPRGWQSVPGLYAPFRREVTDAVAVKRIVVTVGTTEYCFRRLISRLVEVIPAHVEVFWQVGSSDITDLDIVAHQIVDADMLRAEIAMADVVITHAGAGSLLQTLEAGQIPVYVPRRQSFGEQIDDHQVELADWAHTAGLAVRAEADEVTWQTISDTARLRAIAVEAEPILLERR